MRFELFTLQMDRHDFFLWLVYTDKQLSSDWSRKVQMYVNSSGTFTAKNCNISFSVSAVSK